MLPASGATAVSNVPSVSRALATGLARALAAAALLSVAAAQAVDAPQAPLSSVSSSISADEQRCAAAWREFHRSEACFARYHVVGGGIKAEAAKHCREIVQPQCPDPGAVRN